MKHTGQYRLSALSKRLDGTRRAWRARRPLRVALFARLISHQLAVLFSQNKPATNQQYSSLRTNQHQSSATSQPNRLVVEDHHFFFKKNHPAR
jgi:hypothetical protein